MSDLLRPELLTVDGRTYRALYKPGGATQQQRRRGYDAKEHGEEEDWGASGAGGTGGWQEEEPEDEPSVDIVQEGDGFVARLGLDSEVGRGGGRVAECLLEATAHSCMCHFAVAAARRRHAAHDALPPPRPCPSTAVPIADWAGWAHAEAHRRRHGRPHRIPQPQRAAAGGWQHHVVDVPPTTAETVPPSIHPSTRTLKTASRHWLRCAAPVWRYAPPAGARSSALRTGQGSQPCRDARPPLRVPAACLAGRRCRRRPGGGARRQQGGSGPRLHPVGAPGQPAA